MGRRPVLRGLIQGPLASTFLRHPEPGKRGPSASGTAPQLEAKLVRKNEVLAELMEEHTLLKNAWGALNKCSVPHDTRDQIVDFVRDWTEKCDIPVSHFLPWIGVGTSKFHDWKRRFGKVNEHNAWVPRDH